MIWKKGSSYQFIGLVVIFNAGRIEMETGSMEKPNITRLFIQGLNLFSTMLSFEDAGK